MALLQTHFSLVTSPMQNLAVDTLLMIANLNWMMHSKK